MLPRKLQAKIEKRIAENSLRNVGKQSDLIDFTSNDYLGFSSSKSIYKRALEIATTSNLEINGATGSRLLSGNHALYEIAETQIARYHAKERALIFSSGYAANLGFFSCVPQRGDIILYDEFCHASIREGIQLSAAKAYKFKHNDVQAVEVQCKMARQLEKAQLTASQLQNVDSEIYLVTESVFSMDGDQPDVDALISLCKKYNCRLVLDEAHAIGVIGIGRGVMYHREMADKVFAHIVTFGKALGCHGAAILGNSDLINYLINFARSFIYTTGLPPHNLATIMAAYEELEHNIDILSLLKCNIALLRSKIVEHGLDAQFIPSDAAIHSCIIPGNDRVKKMSKLLADSGFEVKPILSPTVPQGQERLRICLHSFNTEAEITRLVELIATFV